MDAEEALSPWAGLEEADAVLYIMTVPSGVVMTE